MREFSIRNAGIKESKQIIRLNACIFNTNGLVFSARICRKYERTGQKIRNHLFRQRMRMQNDCLLVQDGYGLKNFNHPENRFKNGYERNLATPLADTSIPASVFSEGVKDFTYETQAGGTNIEKKIRMFLQRMETERDDCFLSSGSPTRFLRVLCCQRPLFFLKHQIYDKKHERDEIF